VGELLGAIGVIASLLYLARQMRNAAADTRRATAQAVFTKLNTAFETTSANPQLAGVFVRGTSDLSTLSPEEALQFSSVFFTLVRPYEELFYYRRAGAVNEWVWESVELLVLPALTTPGALEWWAKRQSWFTSAFQAHVAEALPKEALETLKGFEHALEGKVFMGGMLLETEDTETGSTGTEDTGTEDTATASTEPLAKEAGQ
jgi:hypothetical protein